MPKQVKNKKTTKKQPKRQTKKPSKVIEKNNQEPDIFENIQTENPNSTFNVLFPVALLLFAVLLFLDLLIPSTMGALGGIIHNILYGLFSATSYSIPVTIVICALQWRKDLVKRSNKKKIIFAIICTILLSVIYHNISYTEQTFDPITYYTKGMGGEGGGLIGGVIAYALVKLTGKVGCNIITVSLLALFILALFDLNLRSLIIRIRYAIHQHKIARQEEEQIIMEQLALEEEEKKARIEAERLRRSKTNTEAIKKNTPKVQKNDISEMPILEDENENTDEYENNPENDSYEDAPTYGFDDVKSSKEVKNSKSKKEISYEDIPFVYDDEAFDDEKDFRPGRQFIKNSSITPVKPAVDEAVSEEEKADEGTALGIDTQDFDYESEDNNAQKDADIPFEKEKEEDITSVSFAEISSNNLKKQEIAENKESEKASVPEVIIRPPVNEPEEHEKPLISDDLIKKVQADIEQKQEEISNLENDDTLVDDYQMEQKREYVFPPVSILSVGVAPENTDISEELQTTAKLLVKTLTSFKVKTKIVNISRGPTITRYELMPEEGTRVKQIANLVDDISLNLATTGVRIEAPIPNKQAVGIEVPNRVVSTVWLRELVDTQLFRESKSKLNACLGKDVAGEPIFVDIAKTPHLLIAGATGMGKSVCINSIIVSLLYKASPKDVKLILIDPKKVELNIYNGLPHLLVPVVTDPKKAAGALGWAVGEMERRYTLIEEANTRNIEGYNDYIKDHPEKEPLPKIVIVIDELSDLMMMAKDKVEESICRIAQKARAAGMHLIIGTQRPSVNVVTGLIKANVPSRIAFTMSSQVDSRTVIDIAGAEKLIGRGDMLYAPVGELKPIRVQGAFVTENEILAVLEFIKSHYGSGAYDDTVIHSIDKEAEGVGQKKNASGETVGEEGTEEVYGAKDPLLKSAIEHAVNNGTTSTSSLQRRLRIGFGRAANLIDIMESMGIVSPPNGQRPRNVLISREEYMEMVLKGDFPNL